MRAEVAAFPETLGSFRTSVVQLQTITERLVVATEGIELMQRHLKASGALDAARALDDAVIGVERQVVAARDTAMKLPGAKLVEDAVSEIQRGVNDIAGRFTGPVRDTDS